MSSAEIAATVIKDLDETEVFILLILDKYIHRFNVFPIETLSRISGIPVKKLRKICDKLIEKELVNKVTAPYEGVILRASGLDALSLLSLSSLNIISHFGKKIGTGKESDIYEALTPNGERISLKFYRIGRTSFRDVLRKRRYVFPTEYVPWFIRSMKAAEKEYEALTHLYGRGVEVPKPIARDRHVVAMEFLDGEIVAKAREVLNPDLVLIETLRIVKKAYQAGYVNGDLSAYNVFVTVDGRVLIIDWPQAVKSRSKHAFEKLEKDVKNLCEYFNKRFSLSFDYKKELERIIK